MALSESQIQELYVAYFGRPADVEGKAYWSGSNTGISTVLGFAANMHSQAEFQDAFGSKKSATQVNEIYQNLFSRDADAAGLEYWTGQIANGTLQLAEIAVHLIWAAKNNDGGSADKTALENKVAAATAFTADVAADAAAQLAYTADDSNAFTTAKTFISGITSTAATAAEIDTQVASVVSGAGVTGSTYNLTTVANSIVGTENNDTIKGVISSTASQNTFTVLDSIDGGKGVDVFELKVGDDAGGTSTPAFPNVSITNIETVQIQNLDADSDSGSNGDFIVDFTSISGATKAINNLSTGSVNFDNLAAGAVVEVIGNTGVAGANAHTTAGYTSGATSSTVTFSGGVDVGDLKVTGSKITSQTIKSTGAQNNIDTITLATSTKSLTIDAASKFETAGALDFGGTTKLTITGAGAVDLDDGTNAIDSSTVTVDGSGSTGDIDLELANVTIQSKAANAAATVTTGSGNDEISLTAVDADRHLKIDTGAGNDVIYVDQLIGTSSSTVHGDVIDGGDGTDALSMASGTANNQSTAANTVSNIEEITLTGLSSGHTLTTKNFQSGISVVNLDGANAGGTVAFEAGSNTIDIKVASTGSLTASAAGTGTTDSLTINLVAAVDGIDDQSLDLNGIETFTFNTATASAVTQTIDDIDLTGVSTGGTATVNFTGSNAITFASGSIVSANVLDFSAVTGVVTMGAGSGRMEYIGASGSGTLKGGSKGDTLRGDDNEAMTIEGGAGNDDITGGSGVDTINGGAGNDTINASTGKDIIDGGEGKDTINLGAAAQTIDGGAGDDTVITGTALAYGQSIKGGEGTDILSIAQQAASSAADAVSGFETLLLAGALTQDVTKFSNNTFTTVTSAGGIAVNIDGIVDETVCFTTDAISASSVDLKSSSGSADSIKLKFSDTSDEDFAAALTVASVETLNIESDNSNTTITSEVDHIVDIVATSATTINLTGDAGINLNGGSENLTKVTTLDASGMSINKATYLGVTYASSFATNNGSVTITGSGGKDVLTGNSMTNDTISGGAGVDTITYTGGKDSFTGGAGKDSFTLTARQDDATSNFLTIEDFTAGDVLDLSANGLSIQVDDATSGLGAKISLGSSATFTEYLENACAGNKSTSDGATSWFNFSGDTYLVVDSNSGATFNAADLLVKFTGTLDLSNSTVASSSEILLMV